MFTLMSPHCPFASIPDVFFMFVLTVDGKLEDGRPSLLAKLLSSGSVPELGHSSSSEGEKEGAPPEWDVPLSKNSVRKSRSRRYCPVAFLCRMLSDQPSKDQIFLLSP